MRDDQIIAAIKKGSTERDKAVKHLFLDKNLKNSIFGILRKMGAEMHDFQDVFQEGLIAFIRNVLEEKFKAKSGVRTYLTSICKYQWLNQQKKMSKIDYPDVDTSNWVMSDELTPENIFLSEERMELNEEMKKILRQALNHLGERCKLSLSLWSENKPMKLIQKTLGFKNLQSAITHKYRCMKRFRKIIMADPDLMNFLKSRIS